MTPSRKVTPLKKERSIRPLLAFLPEGYRERAYSTLNGIVSYRELERHRTENGKIYLLTGLDHTFFWENVSACMDDDRELPPYNSVVDDWERNDE